MNSITQVFQLYTKKKVKRLLNVLEVTRIMLEGVGNPQCLVQKSLFLNARSENGI